METTLLAIGLAVLYLALVLAVEYVRRRFKLNAEITRRFAHISAGTCSVIYFQLLPSPHFLILTAISLIVVIFSQRFGWFTSIHEVKRRTYGEIFLPLGALTTWGISLGDPKIYIPSILVLTFADTAAGFVSNFYKEQRKMIRGSLVFFLIALAILLATGSSLPEALVFALILTAVERFSPYGTDNLTVPAAAALLLLFLKF